MTAHRFNPISAETRSSFGLQDIRLLRGFCFHLTANVPGPFCSRGRKRRRAIPAGKALRLCFRFMYIFLPVFLWPVTCRGQLQIHQININTGSIDFEEPGEGTQLPKAVFFIKPDGTGIVAAHFQIQLLKAVFSGEG